MGTYLASLVLAVAILLPQSAPKPAATPPAIINPLPPLLEAPRAPLLTWEEYAEFAAKDHSINPRRFSALIRCESQGDENAVGDRGTSFGILQFKKETFAHFTKKYELPDYNLWNPQHQIDLAARMLKNGHIAHWETCAKKQGWI